MNNCVPITLITGYLGSGKTTLLNNLLQNADGYKIAVIVNDIGEVNIDAELIEKGGIVNKKEESLVALQNGCICCTLKEDLIQQIAEIIRQDKFDHIVIEASGICEPIPIAQTLEFLHNNLKEVFGYDVCKLDAVVSVVDAIRLSHEFGCGEGLKKDKVDDEDIENLIIQQIEFCDILIINKVDDVSKDNLEKIKLVLKKLQPSAKVIETNYSKVNISEILDTNLFDFENALTSAGWVKELEKDIDVIEEENKHHHDHDSHTHNEEDCHCHEHHEDDCDCHNGGECNCNHKHHHHDHDHCCGDHAHGEEYGISTFVYYRRKPFDRLNFEDFVSEDFGRKIIRTKGVVYFEGDEDMSYLYEQAGSSKILSENGPWYAAMLTEEEIQNLLKEDITFKKDWDEKYGDRMIKLVFIGQHLDKHKLIEKLDRI